MLATALMIAAISSAQITVYRNLEWFPLDCGNESLIGTKKKFLIGNQKDYETYLQEAFGRKSSPFNFNVPWDRVMLLAIHGGPCATTGFELYVQSVKPALSGGITVGYAWRVPPMGENVRAMRTSPYMLIMIERRDGVISYLEQLTSEPMYSYYDRNPISGFGCRYPYYDRSQCNNCSCCGNGYGEPRLLYTEIYYPNLSNYFSGATAMPAIQWRTYKDGLNSNFKDYRQWIIQTEGDWQMYWKQAFGQPPQNAPKDVKWGKELLIALHAGEQSLAGSKIYVESITRPDPDKIMVSFVVSTPPADAKVQKQSTQPWTIIRMDRAAGNIQFARRNKTSVLIPGNSGCKCGGRCGCRCCR